MQTVFGYTRYGSFEPLIKVDMKLIPEVGQRVSLPRGSGVVESVRWEIDENEQEVRIVLAGY